MIRIETLEPDDWTIAMNLALALVPATERPARVASCLNLLANGTLDTKAIRIARDESGIVVGVQVCVPLQGASCLYWLPAGREDVADALIDHCLAMGAARGVKIAQAFVKAEDLPRAQPLLRRGFCPVTSMLQMEHTLGELPAPPDAGLRFVSLPKCRYDDFKGVLQRTYDGTLDCPELNGRRTIDEIIAGHQAEGKYDPERWWLAYLGKEPVGVIMLAELLDGITWDLAYLGIVPEHRRHGLGRAMVRHALGFAFDQTTTRLLAAVDARNLPALRLYRKAGFVDVSSCEVLLRFEAEKDHG